jgi:hypothetical protein
MEALHTGGSAPRTPWCDSSGGMRVLAVAAALTLAVAAPAAGAPSLGSSGCPLFPADNVWHADFASGTWEGGPIGILDPAAGADPAPAPGPTGFVPQLLTAVLGLIAAALAARGVAIRTRQRRPRQDQDRPSHRRSAPGRNVKAEAPPDPGPTPPRRR